jgi:ribosomal-protein-alanine N-acetyltransferase
MLRGYQPTDLSALADLFADPKATQYLLAERRMSEDEVARFIESVFTFGDCPTGLGSLVESATQATIGFAGLLPCKYLDADDLEFGFALATSAWGKGYATEIGRRQIQYGFVELQKERLLALAHPSNVASLRVLCKLGMSRLTTIDVANRGPRDVYVISRTDDWMEFSELGDEPHPTHNLYLH